MAPLVNLFVLADLAQGRRGPENCDYSWHVLSALQVIKVRASEEIANLPRRREPFHVQIYI
jgi:hypothetical protein